MWKSLAGLVVVLGQQPGDIVVGNAGIYYGGPPQMAATDTFNRTGYFERTAPPKFDIDDCLISGPKGKCLFTARQADAMPDARTMGTTTPAWVGRRTGERIVLKEPLVEAAAPPSGWWLTAALGALLCAWVVGMKMIHALLDGRSRARSAELSTCTKCHGEGKVRQFQFRWPAWARWGALPESVRYVAPRVALLIGTFPALAMAGATTMRLVSWTVNETSERTMYDLQIGGAATGIITAFCIALFYGISLGGKISDGDYR